METTVSGLINKYENEILRLEKEINELERISDKLILARHIMATQKFIEDLEVIKNGSNN